MSTKYKGKISNLKNGFGFIDYDKGSIFFHGSQLVADSNFNDLSIGDELEFIIGIGNDGREAASNCKVIGGIGETIKFLEENALIAPSDGYLYDEFCDSAREYAVYLASGKVTTSMIRNIYSRILVADDAVGIKMLRPQFAYTAGRNQDNVVLKNFMELLDKIVSGMQVEDNKREVDNFKSFMEAIVAYRKYVAEDK